MTERAGATPLPEIDQAMVKTFFQTFLAAEGLPSETPLADAFQFGDSVELADSLIGLVLNGPKRATAGSLAEYENDGASLPQVGDLLVACDGPGQPAAVLRTTDVRIGPLSSVDAAFSWDEGEGDRSLEYWVDAHTRYFKRAYQRLGLPFHTEILIAFERFELL